MGSPCWRDRRWLSTALLVFSAHTWVKDKDLLWCLCPNGLFGSWRRWTTRVHLRQSSAAAPPVCIGYTWEGLGAVLLVSDIHRVQTVSRSSAFSYLVLAWLYGFCFGN